MLSNVQFLVLVNLPPGRITQGGFLVDVVDDDVLEQAHAVRLAFCCLMTLATLKLDDDHAVVIYDSSCAQHLRTASVELRVHAINVLL